MVIPNTVFFGKKCLNISLAKKMLKLDLYSYLSQKRVDIEETLVKLHILFISFQFW